MISQEQYKKLQPKLASLEADRLKKRYEYLGLLTEYQLISKDLTQPIVYTKLNPYQHFYLKECYMD